MLRNAQSHANGAGAENRLQSASDLLTLLADESIWAQLVRGGLCTEERLRLAEALEAARRCYRLHRQQLEQRAAPGDMQDVQLAVTLRGHDAADASLQGVAGSIRAIGQQLFAGTHSLARRFALSESTTVSGGGP